MTDAREKRWLVVTQDGRHATLGRHTDPSPDEVAAAGSQLDTLGVAGWLAVSEGVYYSKTPVILLFVRSITTLEGNWDEAVSAFQQNARVSLLNSMPFY